MTVSSTAGHAERRELAMENRACSGVIAAVCLGGVALSTTGGCGSRTGFLDLSGTTAVDSGATLDSAPSSDVGSPDASDAPGDCCPSALVPGGSFYRTYTNDGSGPTGEADPATISSFRLDTTLVTVGRFRAFVRAWNGGNGWTPPAGSGKHAHLNGGLGLVDGDGHGYEMGWDPAHTSDVAPTDANLGCSAGSGTWTAAPGDGEDLPITCVNAFEAYAFCIWDGGFLPSETEWEYAAAGGSEQREYPWGTADPGSDDEYAVYAFHYQGGPNGGPIAPVGTATKGAGSWGQLDLVGEVFEWTLDYWDDEATFPDPCDDCARLTPTPHRSAHGGDFGADTSDLKPPYRPPVSIYDYDENDRYTDMGFRCARSP
jgi:formylglycine-generating enzyme